MPEPQIADRDAATGEDHPARCELRRAPADVQEGHSVFVPLQVRARPDLRRSVRFAEIGDGDVDRERGELRQARVGGDELRTVAVDRLSPAPRSRDADPVVRRPRRLPETDAEDIADQAPPREQPSAEWRPAERLERHADARALRPSEREAAHGAQRIEIRRANLIRNDGEAALSDPGDDLPTSEAHAASLGSDRGADTASAVDDR